MKLNLTTEQKEITIRKGDALPAKPGRSIIIAGVFSAPFQFLEGKSSLAADTENIHLLIHGHTGKLELHLRDQDPYVEHVITGSLSRDSNLALFQINSDKRWTVREFVKFIKTMRYYFAERDEATAIVDSLNKWQAKVETVIKDHNDTSGNSLLMLERKVGDIQLKTKFALNVPIFQGYPKVKFTVEIGLDPKANQVDLYLISDELIELEAQTRETIIEKELKQYEKWAFSKVRVS